MTAASAPRACPAKSSCAPATGPFSWNEQKGSSISKPRMAASVSKRSPPRCARGPRMASIRLDVEVDSAMTEDWDVQTGDGSVIARATQLVQRGTGRRDTGRNCPRQSSVRDQRVARGRGSRGASAHAQSDARVRRPDAQGAHRGRYDSHRELAAVTWSHPSGHFAALAMMIRPQPRAESRSTSAMWYFEPWIGSAAAQRVQWAIDVVR